MARQVQLRRGTTVQTSTFTGALAEITVDTDKDVVVVHDGSTAGGHPLTKASTLGTAATTAATDYATAAQGTLATTAVQPNDNATLGNVSFTSVAVTGTVDGRDIAADGTKLDGVEASADVTDTVNVTAAGALMDSEITNLSQVKAFDSTDYATSAQGTTADAALPKSGGTMSGDIDGNGNKVLFANVDSAIGDLPSASTYHGMFAHVHATGKGYFAHAGSWVELGNQTDLTSATTTANAALPKSGGAMTGAITTNSTFDGRAVATDGAKLDNITVTQAVDLDQMEIDIAALANGMVYKGDWDASASAFPASGSAQIGWFYYVSVAGTVGGVSFSVGDNIVAIVDNASSSTYAGNWSKHDQTDAVTAVVGLNGSISKSGLLSALNVEDGADVTDATNVTAAGALMDSEVTNLAQVKAFDTTDYATAAQGTTADAALPKAGGTMTGDLSFGDSDKAIFGTGDDLQLYHDGTSSVITSAGGSSAPLKFQRTHTGSFIPSFTFEAVNDSFFGPFLTLKHDTASPSSIDSAYINYDSKNDAAEDVNYAQIQFATKVVTDGSEKGSIYFKTKDSGADKTLLVINGTNADVEIGDDGAVLLSNGTTAQRPSTGQNGMLRYNSTDAQFEGYADGAWGAIAGGGGDTQTVTTTSTTQTALGSYAAATSLGIEITVIATDTVATERTITKLLVTHDGTTAVATQYGEVNTATAVASYDVDISGSNVRLLATAASANSTNFTAVAAILA